MFCKRCGSEIQEGTKLCAKCGETVTPAVIPPIAPSLPDSMPQTSEKTISNKSKTIPDWAWITGASIIAVIIIFVGIMIAVSRNNSKNAVLYSQPSSNPDIEATQDPTTDLEQSDQPETESEPVEPVAPADIEYSLEQLSDAISVWANYKNYWVGCDLGANCTDEAVWGKLNLLPSHVLEMNQSVCCNSREEARQQLDKYLAPDLYADFDAERLVEHQGKLYIPMGTWVRYHTFGLPLNDSQVTRTAYNAILVTTLHDEMGEKYNVRFDFEYVNGVYKIMRIIDLE